VTRNLEIFGTKHGFNMSTGMKSVDGWQSIVDDGMFVKASKLTTAPFGCADKPAEKHCWIICCERKILFQLKKQAEKDGL
jgi:hypothetical protein